eukprot:GHVS01009543.1.p1 GENE.GHVS01009543.1~~GHVS01009543.1.p1  ORF type:complete len:157 (+),score=13.58 GHVS01009543.1:254-724(+)
MPSCPQMFKCCNSGNLRCSSLMIRCVGFGASACLMTAGILSFVLIKFSLLRLAINVYCILFAGILILADIRALGVFGYVKFVYHPIGRGLFLTFMGFLVIATATWQIVLGSIVIVLGIFYAITTCANGGVPKPILQRHVDELPLQTDVRFVDVQGG